MKAIILLSALIAATAGQFLPPPGLSCNYFFQFNTYRCDLTLNNPAGVDDFTGIGGIHLEGFSNANVTSIYRTTGFSPIVPSIICETFPNLQRIMLFDSGLTEITDTSFAGCSEVTELDLVYNRIGFVSENAFATLRSLRYLFLEMNNIATLPENVFSNQQELALLDLNFNPMQNIANGLFRPLVNLEMLFLGYVNLNAVNNEWFTSSSRLGLLFLDGNRLQLTADSFIGLEQLTSLSLSRNGLNVIPEGTFTPLETLEYLFLSGNNFVELAADLFADLDDLEFLDLSQNPLTNINDGAFRGLNNLTGLELAFCRLRQVTPNTFQGLQNLEVLDLDFNQITDLPPGVFAPLPNLRLLGLWNNRIKTLRRFSFGNMANLEAIDLDGNFLNAMDRAVIMDAINLDILFMSDNLCANNLFANFRNTRFLYLEMLERCFANVQFIVETRTDANNQYRFFNGPAPGIALRVNADSEVHIALTPFNFVWNPMLEVFIGTANNTESMVRVNRDDNNVLTVPTPNILQRGQWNDFRITWAEQVILVYRGNSPFPFLGFTMRDFFPVNSYGVRAVDSEAVWSVQRLNSPMDVPPSFPPTDPMFPPTDPPVGPPTDPFTSARQAVNTSTYHGHSTHLPAKDQRKAMKYSKWH